MNATHPRVEKYHTLIDDLRQMLDNKSAGLQVAKVLNDEFWEDLGTHKQRLEEQVRHIQSTESNSMLDQELANADSIYEATRSLIRKYK